MRYRGVSPTVHPQNHPRQLDQPLCVKAGKRVLALIGSPINRITSAAPRDQTTVRVTRASPRRALEYGQVLCATAIREVQKGNTFFGPAIARRLNSRDRKSVDREGNLKPKHNRLSSREVEVLQLIAEGKPNKQIAAELGVRFKTADKHRQHLMAKLNIHDVAGLTRYAIAEGIIESSVQLTIT